MHGLFATFSYVESEAMVGIDLKTKAAFEPVG